MWKLKLTRDKRDYERDEEGVGEEKSQREWYLRVLEQSGFSFRSRRWWRRRHRFNAHGFSVFQPSATHFRFIIRPRSTPSLFSFSLICISGLRLMGSPDCHSTPFSPKKKKSSSPPKSLYFVSLISLHLNTGLFSLGHVY